MNKLTSNKQVIFIGGIGSDKEFVGGELTKNKNLICSLKNNGRKVITVDTYNARKKIWRLIPLPFALLFHPKTNIIISTNLGNIYWLIKWFSMVKTKRKVTFIGTGGAFSRWILEGRFKAKHLNILHKIVVQGEKMQLELAQAGLHQSLLLPNNKMIDYQPDLTRINRSADKTRFVFVSRMHEEKGIEMILECALKLNETGLQDQFSIDYYGQFEDEAYRTTFLSKISTVPNVKFNGVLNLRTEAGYDELASYDVMLFPSYWRGEGFPGIIIDALIAGLPIIISDWNFNADYIQEGETGFVIPSKSTSALYEKMKEAIENKELYSSLATKCQKTARLYDSRAILGEEFFESIGV